MAALRPVFSRCALASNPPHSTLDRRIALSRPIALRAGFKKVRGTVNVLSILLTLRILTDGAEAMEKPIVSDELWAEIAPLLPAAKPRRWRHPGRKPVSDRAALTGIVFVLERGIRWRDLPAEMGCGSGVTCWRRM